MPKIIKNTLEKRIQTCPGCGSVWELESQEGYLNECPVCGVNIETHEPAADPKTRTINAIMEDIDFEKIHKVMEFLGWEWWGQGVPSIETIRTEARNHLERAWDSRCSTGSGGFWVEYEGETEEDYPLLRMSFQLCWFGPCWVSKKDNEMQYA